MELMTSTNARERAHVRVVCVECLDEDVCTERGVCFVLVIEVCTVCNVQQRAHHPRRQAWGPQRGATCVRAWRHL
jgi:hypothetical protein